MKQWSKRVALVALGTFLGSLLLENLTRFSIEKFMPVVHDVQFALLITIISTVGGIFGAASTIALLTAKAGHSKLAGWLLLVFGVLGLGLAIPNMGAAPQAFNQNGHPFVDAWAYFGFTLIWSLALVTWGVFLLLKRSPRHLNLGTGPHSNVQSN